jgi:hypothetical protein
MHRCIFPSGLKDGTSRFDVRSSLLECSLLLFYRRPKALPAPKSQLHVLASQASIVRTVPIVVALLIGGMMVCLGPPRQLLGFQNVPDTCPPLDRQLAVNPMYANSQSQDFRDPDREDSELGTMPPSSMKDPGGPPVLAKSASRDPRSSYAHDGGYRGSLSQAPRHSQRAMTVGRGEYSAGGGPTGPSEGGSDYR